MTTHAETSLRWEAPGPGSWTLDAVHFPRPATRYWQEMHPEPFVRGFSEFTRFYGMLIGTLDYRYVNGFVYSTMLPAPESEIPERFQRADEVLEKRLWRDQLEQWDSKFKPESIAAHRAIQAVDPDALSDDELVDHLRRCRAHHIEMIYQHMRHTGAAIMPVGDLMVHVSQWADIPGGELLGLMRGTAPVSAGASEELGALVDALRADPAARELLESDRDPGEILHGLRTFDSDAGRALNAYLELVGYRLLDGFDISGRYALEMPDALVRSIRAALTAPEQAEAMDPKRIAEVRERIPEEHRAEFDDLLGEASLMYRIRDERGVFSDIWASGLMRRAAMAGGRRLAEAGRIRDPEHFVDAGFEEMCALLGDAGEPSADELAARYEYRTTHSAKDAPPVLGDPPHPPPDPSGLPPGPRRVMMAAGTAINALFGSSEAEHEETLLRGIAASGGVYEGVARRVAGPDEFDRIVKGDVLVTESTTEAFNILLPLLGAIVTDAGGLLSHSAIVAREYGIPGVVGTREATQRIEDGATVRVDGDAGEVSLA
ncbi:MAG TPA: PEP-utilizing enzyme [Thermoleophilaceae bacterium]